MKILTIAVCAYNMEEYLRECLNSLLVRQLDKLEVLIMNDGSTDKTAEIAEEFVRRYPDTFILVNKENGGWGSNVNLAVQKASGMYFRELDADDWYNTEVLDEILEDLPVKDVDMYITDHTYWDNGTPRLNKADWKPYIGKKMDMKDADTFFFNVWDVAFRTELIKEKFTDLPGNTLYTDVLVIQYIVAFAENAYFNGESLYNYRLGRDGQSVSRESLFKHYKDLLRVWHETVEFYFTLSEEDRKNKHMLARMDFTYKIYMDHLIKMYDMDKEKMRDAMKEMEDDLKRIDFLYREEGKAKRIRLLRTTNYHGAGIVAKKIGG